MSEDRSRSRGRDLLQSTGRGGFGNIRQSSESRDRPADGPDDFSATRGREPLANPTIMYSTGRGGAGNLRSPSRDASRGPDAREREVIKEYNQTHGDGPVSVGRGGLGNMSRSRSRDPAGGNRGVSTGRGGAGNIHAHEGGYNVNALDEAERKKHEVPAEGFHSTGRGGFANITESHEPDVERPAVHHNAAYHSSGRGGAGNIHTGA
ncbi:hypothetical protein BKA70DRAFT_282827 [Coprinopsis sp. MPI-PUGE-AT-0042]|nr:hypothetical protein BKA70DRAFT_282827 [Coprinopsis sp. MPI-PUGE-AT-0042]